MALPHAMPITYRDAGVDIDAGAELVRRIGPIAGATRTPGVVADVGGFAGLFALPAGLANPVLVAAADGVGTKVEIACTTGRHDTIGIDLVAMCVNDVLTVGAAPLFFLDALSTGRLNLDVAESVIRGIAQGCRQAGCALLGGETAELPGWFPPSKYDLTGVAVGVVERGSRIDGSRASAGDALIGISSSGLHANGYSLVRTVLLDRQGLDLATHLDDLGRTLGEELLEPTRIYASAVRASIERCGATLHAIAHITGGGLVENVPRALPPGLGATIALGSWERPPIFDRIARSGPVEEVDMRRTFNLGVGLVMAVASEGVGAALEALQSAGERAWVLGEVIASERQEVRFV